MTTTTGVQRRTRKPALTMTAYGETKTVWAWGNDPRCFISAQALLFRVKNFAREMTSIDAEAALCFPRWLWMQYRTYGYIEPAHLEALADYE